MGFLLQHNKFKLPTLISAFPVYLLTIRVTHKTNKNTVLPASINKNAIYALLPATAVGYQQQQLSA